MIFAQGVIDMKITQVHLRQIISEELANLENNRIIESNLRKVLSKLLCEVIEPDLAVGSECVLICC